MLERTTSSRDARTRLRGLGPVLSVALSSALLVGCGVPGDPARSGGPSVGGSATSGGNAGTGGSSGVAGSGTGGVAGTGASAGAGAATGGSAPETPEITHKAIHRLSNVEYDNTLRDLTRTELRFGKEFLREEADGFDNIAAALSMSPRQMENYYAAAAKVSADVFAKPELRARIVTCTPDTTTTCAETVIRDFGRKAFRRPLDTAESALLLTKYQEALALGVDAMGALQHVVHILLASPQFLYRIEFDPDLADTTPHALGGYELASRLSYALWSTMPDDTLFEKAAGSELAAPEGLRVEVDRMLADERSEMLVKNFAGQWLGINRLAEHVTSTTLFPAYTPDLAASMQREMELYFSDYLYGDLAYSTFLTNDVNYVDAGLAALYGMAPPTGAGLSRVTNTTDERMGFVGLAGFLTHTSRETRTSPILRGTWILDALWCVHLELPPDLVVEPLPDPSPNDPPTTVREQMEAHRVSDACAGCHDTIDPIGLALENFDAIGRYRGVYENGLAIDATGTMPEGQMVDGLASLVAALSSDPQFLSCAASKFGTYALGAVLPGANRVQIAARWTAGQTTLRNLIKETVSHEGFRFRKAEAP